MAEGESRGEATPLCERTGRAEGPASVVARIGRVSGIPPGKA